MTTPTGATGQMSLSTAAHEITVTGALPKGDTTGTVTYFIVNTANNTVVGQIVLPNATKNDMSVAVPVKVSSARASYAIGTFDDKGFTPSSFLSVRNPTSDEPSIAAVGRAG